MYILASLLLALAAPAASLTRPGSENDELVARIDAAVTAVMEDSAAVGLSVAVAVGDEIVLARGYGLAEVEHGIPVEATTPFRIGSVTKQFTAAAIVRLAEMGKLELDEDVRAYLPDYPETEQVITLRHLLTHTAGIPNYTDLGETFWRDARHDLSHEEMLAKFADLPLGFRPGQAWSYSNSGYYVLGMVLEQVSGQSYDELLRTMFFEPLELSSMRCGSFTDIIPGRAQGYRVEAGELENDAFMSMNPPGAAGALLASAQDLVKWQLALVSGRVVSEGGYAEMTTPFLLEDMSETTYGLGLSLGEFHGRRSVSHGGGIFGFNSELVYLPEERLSVAVISNCEAFPSDRASGAILMTVLEQ